MFAILFLVGLVLAAGGAGRIASRLWSGKSEDGADRLLVDLSLGLGVLSLAVFTISAFQLLRSPLLILIFAIPACVSIVYIIKGDYGRFPFFAFSRFRDKSFLLSAVLLAIIAFVVLIPALAPPSMSDWDSLAYHLSVPKLYLEHGGMYYISFMSHSNFPMLMETLYTLPLKLGCPAAAKMVTYLTAVLLIASVIALTKRHFSEKSAMLAAVALAGMPIVMWLATTAYIDLATALYTVLAVHLLMNYLEEHNQAHLIGSAVAAGFAASTKMTGLGVIPVIAVWIVLDRIFSPSPQPSPAKGEREASAGVSGTCPRNGEQVSGLKSRYTNATSRYAMPLLLFLRISLLVCSPWYVKSFIYTGNPVYPFFYSIFGGRDWTSGLASFYTAQQAKFGMGHDITSFLMLPYNLALHSERFYDTPGLFVGPIFLVGLPILLLARYESRKLKGLGLFFLALLVTWFALTHQSRYLVPGFAVLSILIAALAYGSERFRFSRYALWVVFVLTSIFGIWTVYPAVTNAAPVVFGKESREDYLNRTLDVYPADQWINENLPKDAKLALFGDTRGFYLDRKYVWADPGHNAEFTRSFASAKELVDYLKSRHMTHVMINFRFYPKRGKGSQPLYDAIDRGLLEQIYPDGDGFGCAAVYLIR